MVQGPSATYIFAQCQCIQKSSIALGTTRTPSYQIRILGMHLSQKLHTVNVYRLNLYFAMESTPSPTALDPSARAHVRRLVRDVTCCAGLGCRVSANRVSWAKGAFGSQANTMLTVMVANLLNGTATSASRMHFVPFTQDRVSPQRFVDSKRCRVHGQGSTGAACLFVPIESLCKSGHKSGMRGDSGPISGSTVGSVSGKDDHEVLAPRWRADSERDDARDDAPKSAHQPHERERRHRCAAASRGVRSRGAR